MKATGAIVFYETVRHILYRLKPLRKNRLEIKKKISKDFKPQNYVGVIHSYLHSAIQMVDTEAKEAFWDVFYDDFDDFYIAYYGLQLEGLYDMVLLDQTNSPFNIPEPMPFSSLSFQWVRDIIDHAQNKAKPVLIVGATGTSKDAVASVIHKLSLGIEKPYIAINCAAFPEHLIESELFGYEPGAFTGALKKKKGIIQEANKGTLFLDELGKTSLNFQSKLLRFIDTGNVRPVGADKDTKVDVRVIGAVQPNIIDDDDKFLPDLKYRFGFPYCIKMPTLKERFTQFRGNIYQSIINNSLHVVLYKMEMRNKINILKIAYDSFKLLEDCDFKGNYRELENILMSAVKSARRSCRDILQPEDFHVLKSARTKAEAVKAAADVNIKLKDVFSYADDVRATIVAAKIKAVLDSGRDVKPVLANEYAAEGLTLSDSTYNIFTRRVKTVTGKAIGDFKKSVGK